MLFSFVFVSTSLSFPSFTQDSTTGDPWVAQRFGACLWLGAWSWSPGIESHVGLLAWSLLLPPPVSLPLSVSHEQIKSRKEKKRKEKKRKEKKRKEKKRERKEKRKKEEKRKEKKRKEKKRKEKKRKLPFPYMYMLWSCLIGPII